MKDANNSNSPVLPPALTASSWMRLLRQRDNHSFNSKGGRPYAWNFVRRDERPKQSSFPCPTALRTRIRITGNDRTTPKTLSARISLVLALSCGAGFPACHPQPAFRNGRLESLPHMRKTNPYARQQKSRAAITWQPGFLIQLVPAEYRVDLHSLTRDY